MRIKLLISILFVGIAIVVTIGSLFYSSIIGSDSVDAGSFGISPPYIKAVDLRPGDSYKQSIRILRGSSNVEQKVTARFDDLVIANWFIIHPSETIIIKKGEKYANFNFELKVPANAHSGEYQGKLYFAISSANNNSGVSLALGARAEVDVNIIGGKDFVEEPRIEATVSQLSDNELASRLQGRFIMRSLSYGQIYYLHPVKNQIYYLSNPEAFLELAKNEARGISNELLDRIPVLLLAEDDEQAPEIDSEIAKSLSGFLLLQAEDKGQLWYVSPVDNKRVLLTDISDILDVLEGVALGISEENYQKLVQ